MTEKPKMGSISRAICFLFGLILASYMFLFSFNYEAFPHTITIMGYDLTGWIVIACLVLLTILAGWLIKIGITGRVSFG